MLILIFVIVIIYSSLILIFWNLYLYIKSNKKKFLLLSLICGFVFSLLVWSFVTNGIYGGLDRELKLPGFLLIIPMFVNLLLTICWFPMLPTFPFIQNKVFRRIFYFCTIFFFVSIFSNFLSFFYLNQYFSDNFYNYFPYVIT